MMSTPSQPAKRVSAVALSADRSSDARGAMPLVVAKGYGAVAESIVQRAREHGLYVHESADLVKLLMHVDLDQHIPPQMYVVVAELLAWLYGIEADAATRPLGSIDD